MQTDETSPLCVNFSSPKKA